MVSGLPDYTKYVSPQVTVVESDRPFGTKAETVDKKMAYARGNDGAADIHLQAEIGKSIGLVLLVATTNGGSARLHINHYYMDSEALMLDGLNVEVDAPLVLPFPCWIPDQDPSDGVHDNLVIQIAGSCGEMVNLTVIYFEEGP